MTTDERLEQRLTASGFDLETDEGAFHFQQELDRILEAERRKGQQRPVRQTERVRGIQI